MPLSGTFAGVSARGEGLFELLSLGQSYWIASLADSLAAASQYDQGLGITVDSSGNVYTAGSLSNTDNNAYLTKYNTTGTLQWQRKLVDTNTATNRNDVTHGIAVDGSGNVYITGYFLNSSSSRNVFIIKYNTSGTLQWQRKLADTSNANDQNDWGLSIAVDGSGNVYVTGRYGNLTVGNANVFITKYNTSGTIQWKRKLAGTAVSQSQYDVGFGIAVDSSGNVYVTGSTYTSVGTTGAVIIKYNTSGTIQWQRQLSDSNFATYNDTGFGIAVDSSSNVYVTGSFLNSSSGTNAFITKYNTSGTIQWQRKLSDSLTAASQSDFGYSIAVDSSGNVYVTGTWKNASNGYNAFIAKYNSSGSIQWQRKLSDSLSAVNQNDVGYGIYVDSFGVVYITGNFSNSSSGTNAFILKAPNDGSKTGTYTMGTGQTLTYATGTLTDAAGTLTDAAGTLTDSASTIVDGAGVMIDSAGSLTSVTTVM